MARDNGQGGSGDSPRREFSRNGEHVTPTGPAKNDPYADIGADAGPVDLVAVRRDDAFLDAISGEGPIATDDADEYQLALLLADWRADIISPAMPAGPDLDAVVMAVERESRAAEMARNSSNGRLRLLRPLAGAAAAIAVVMGGLVVVSYDSSPGDPLWSVKSVVFSQQADSTVAQIDTTSKLQQAEELISAGDVDGARTVLDSASGSSGAVIDGTQRSELDQWLTRLLQEVEAMVPPLPLPLPPIEAPQLPIPPVPGVDVVPPPATSVPVAPELTAPPVSPAPSSPSVDVPTPGTTGPSVTPTSGIDPSILRVPNPPTATAGGSDATVDRTRLLVPSQGGS